MHFLVDTVSDYSFFQNILLGLADSLWSRVGITRTFVKKLPPLSNSEISVWEQEHGVILPDGLHAFYSATDGFLFEWKYCIGDAENSNEVVVGRININPLDKMKQIYGYETTNDSGIKYNMHNEYEIRLAPESRIFELSHLPDRGKVVLVYLYPESVPTIWLLTSNMKFHFLANDVATYLRMAIAHLGVSNWQFSCTKEGIPSWSENIFRLIVPHLLPLDNIFEREMMNRGIQNDDDYSQTPVNQLDQSIFERPPSIVPILQPHSPEHSTLHFSTEKLFTRKVSLKPEPRGLSKKLLRYTRKR